MNNKIYLGKFEQTGNKILVSDPGYDFDSDKYSEKAWNLNVLINNVRKGTWHAWVAIDDDSERNGELIALHEDEFNNGDPDFNGMDWKKREELVCVDSGQAGIYDVLQYKNDCNTDGYKLIEEFENNDEKGEKWYGMNCKITTSKNNAGIIPFGVVSSSGFGDGMYELYTCPTNGPICGIKIIFINDEEKEKFLAVLKGHYENTSYDDNHNDDDSSAHEGEEIDPDVHDNSGYEENDE